MAANLCLPFRKVSFWERERAISQPVRIGPGITACETPMEEAPDERLLFGVVIQDSTAPFSLVGAQEAVDMGVFADIGTKPLT